MNNNYENLVGKKFGKLTVTSETRDLKGKLSWKCKCECGNEIITVRNALTSGRTRSCGCIRKGINKKHGHRYEPIYIVYCAMLKRCRNQNDKSYKNYGGRGITVCEEWQKDFMIFYNWAIRNGYDPKLTLDRENVNGNYEPSNCRWVDNYIQARNKRIEKINKTGISGVQFRKDKKDYRAVITANNKRYSLGCYKTIEEAKEARKQGELKYWGFTNIK